MRILVVGSGGREHAIIWKLKQDDSLVEIFCAPGNAGISELATCVPIKATDIYDLVNFAKENRIDFTIVGMDDPLVLGIVDIFEENNLKIFGPCKKAAMLEGSKAFSKELMKKYNIPTAKYKTFDNFDEAVKYIQTQKYPLVIKADGLAFGKGVVICNNILEATDSLQMIMKDKKFGVAGDKVIIEEFLTGKEVSILAFCDGKTVVPMVSSQDHKKALDNDLGLNTGGMGAISPSRYYDKKLAKICYDTIFEKTVHALISENIKFVGIIFFGIILTEDGPKVIEYNARFGDPETQVVIPRLKSNLLEILIACVDSDLSNMDIKWYNSVATCVIIASLGYPEKYETGKIINIDENITDNKKIIIYHSGTKKNGKKLVTNGGRVIGVTGISDTFEDSIDITYKAIKGINFEKMYFRNDIGKK